jgi:hypothetical protein
MLRLRVALLIGWVAAAVALHGAEPSDVRFSQSLAAEQRSTVGLARLNSDEVAVIDALVRRDTTQRIAVTAAKGGEKSASTFTKRLNESQRTAAGLAKLTADEVHQLDTAVDRFQNARLARTLLAPPTYLSRGRAKIATEDAKPDRKIHGSFSFSLGWGSGGYSEQTGSMVLNYDDPAGRYSVSVGYSESRIKGGSVYRDPYYDPFYRPHDPLPPLRDPQ